MTNQDPIFQAVKGLNEGFCDQYNAVVQELKKTTLETPCTYLNSLRRAIKHINKKHEALIGVILDIDWSSYDGEETPRVFVEFLAELVSVRTFYVNVCLRSLVKQLVPKTEVSEENMPALRKKCEHIHTAIRTILHIAPLSSKFIVGAAKHNFPYLGKKLFILETYTFQLLQLATYARDVRLELLQLLIDKIISIDVLTHRHKLQHVCESEEENVNKLDQLMVILFTYVDTVSFMDGVLDYEGSRSLFKDFLAVHQHFIMKTQCTHVQFLLFYMSSFHKVG